MVCSNWLCTKSKECSNDR